MGTLTGPRPAPEREAPMNIRTAEGATTLIWIDSEEAIIVRWADRANIERIRSDVPARHKLDRSPARRPQRAARGRWGQRGHHGPGAAGAPPRVRRRGGRPRARHGRRHGRRSGPRSGGARAQAPSGRPASRAAPVRPLCGRRAAHRAGPRGPRAGAGWGQAAAPGARRPEPVTQRAAERTGAGPARGGPARPEVTLRPCRGRARVDHPRNPEVPVWPCPARSSTPHSGARPTGSPAFRPVLVAHRTMQGLRPVHRGLRAAGPRARRAAS